MDEIREGDIYRIKFNEANHTYSHHCFENQLHAERKGDGWVFADRYWHDKKNRFSEERIAELGELELICNTNDIESAHRHDLKRYKQDDIVWLTSQHGCCESCRAAYTRKGAQIDKETILADIRNELDGEKHKQRWAARRITQLSEAKAQVEGGDLKAHY